MASKRGWDVHKFGGTSVNGPVRYRKVVSLALQFREESPNFGIGIVVSAMSGVTDSLYKLCYLALESKEEEYKLLSQQILKRHIDCLTELFGDKSQPPPTELCQIIERDIRDIVDVLRAILLSKSCAESLYELVSGYGELWSAKVLASYINLMHPEIKCRSLDARDVLIVENLSDSRTNILWDKSEAKMQQYLSVTNDTDDIIIITGYVASTESGIPTTLKRNGSDFSGAIFGAILRAKAITIWTDVDGVFSADPRKVKGAVMLDEMSYEEAMELAFFGAKVLHPHTMAPAVLHGIPIYIKNTFNSTCPGTKIHKANLLSHPTSHIVKGISSIENVALVNLEGSGMIGVPGICQRLFSGLKDQGVSVIMISQASSEHSICFAIPLAQADVACRSVKESFYRELATGQIQMLDVKTNCAILAIVGDGMKTTAGVAARVCGALADDGVNCVAIAQGSSERNISIVVSKEQATRALQAVHRAYFTPKKRQEHYVAVFVDDFESKTTQELTSSLSSVANVRLGAILSKQSVWFGASDKQFPADWASVQAEKAQVASVTESIEKIRDASELFKSTLIVDFSASGFYASHYEKLSSFAKVLSADPFTNWTYKQATSKALDSALFTASYVGASVIKAVGEFGKYHKLQKAIFVLPSFWNDLLKARKDGSKESVKAFLDATLAANSEAVLRHGLDSSDSASQLIELSAAFGVELTPESIFVKTPSSSANSQETINADAVVSEMVEPIFTKFTAPRVAVAVNASSNTGEVSITAFEANHVFASYNRYGAQIWADGEADPIELTFSVKEPTLSATARIQSLVNGLKRIAGN